MTQSKLRPFLLVLMLLGGSALLAQHQRNPILDILDGPLSTEEKIDSISNVIYYTQMFSDQAMARRSVALLDSFSKAENNLNGKGYTYKYQGMINAISGDNNIALSLMERSLELFKETGNIKEIGRAWHNIANLHYLDAHFLEAARCVREAIRVKEQTKDPTLPKSLQLYSSLLIKMGQPEAGIDHQTRALNLAIASNDKASMLMAYNGLGNTYLDARDFASAKRHYLLSLNIALELQSFEAGVLYNNLAKIKRFEMTDLDSALILTRKAEAIFLQTGNLINLGNCYLEFGRIYASRKDYDSAQLYFLKSLEQYKQNGNQRYELYAYRDLGHLLLEQGHYRAALGYLDPAYAIAAKHELIDEQRSVCEWLSQCHKGLGNHQQTARYMEELVSLEKQLKTDELNKSLLRMEFQQQLYADSVEQAETDRLVQEAHDAEVARNRRTRNAAIGGGILALLLAGGFYSRWRFIKRSKAVIEKERDRSENLLLNILPAEIAEELKEKGEAAARDFDQVSILFTDFKQFTQLSEQLSAKELVEELNYCFKAFDAICERYGIEKIKTVGDAYMAAAGLPVPHQDSTRNMVLAALDMAEFVLNRQRQKEQAGQVPFMMRTGIHTGNVVAGIVGVKKFQYDVWGDTVNTASRMESNGEVGKVNISQATYQLIKDDPTFQFEHRGKIEVKGKGEMDMYFVTLR